MRDFKVGDIVFVEMDMTKRLPLSVVEGWNGLIGTVVREFSGGGMFDVHIPEASWGNREVMYDAEGLPGLRLTKGSIRHAIPVPAFASVEEADAWMEARA